MPHILHRVLLLIFLLLCVSCASTQSTDQETKTAAVQPEPPAIDPFEDVRVVLGRACAPCHNPGGKMYERLPFDQPEVIRSHKEGILRRLDPEDKKRVENWLLTQ